MATVSGVVLSSPVIPNPAFGGFFSDPVQEGIVLVHTPLTGAYTPSRREDTVK